MNKELEEINKLKRFNKIELNNDENVNKSLDIIETALQQKEKQDKAIKLMINKNITIEGIIKSENYTIYNNFYPIFEKEELTKNQFDLLKEVLI